MQNIELVHFLGTRKGVKRCKLWKPHIGKVLINRLMIIFDGDPMLKKIHQ